MRFAFITTMAGFPWGGSEELWYRTALHLLHSNHKVIVSVYHWEEEPKAITQLRVAGATIIKSQKQSYRRLDKLLLNKLKKKLFPNSFDRSFKEIIKYKPDVVVFSQGGTFDVIENSDYALLIKSLKTKYYIISQCNFESGGLQNLLKRENSLDFLKNAVSFYFVSARNKITAERQLASNILNGKLISNPLNVRSGDIRPYVPLNNNSECLTIACVARLQCSFKGQDILLQTLHLNNWKVRNFQLSFYGKGPDQEHIERLIKLYELDDKVILKGHISNIEEIWLNNQALVLPSLIEGTPLSMLEAMFSGRPIVGTDVGDMYKYILDGKTGFLAPTASISALTKALEDLWKCRANLDEMGAAAYLHAKSITDLSPEKTLADEILLHSV